jgi:alpha-D-xyloside xylohydrolase
VPWNYDEEACDVLRFFTKLKCRLMPYLYGAAIEAHREGIPMMRAMVLEFPNDRACDTLDGQYLLGGSLLVAPVFTSDGGADYYLPEGRWTHLLTGEVRAGPHWHRAQHDFLSLPLFVRPGSILALGACEDRPDYDYAANVTFSIFELAENTTLTCEVPTTHGEPAVRLTVTRQGPRIHAVLAEKPVAPWRLQLVGVSTVRTSQPQTSDPLGVIITAPQGGHEVVCELP